MLTYMNLYIVLAGLAGLVLHFLKRQMAPQDESLGNIMDYFKTHLKTTLMSFLSYGLACLMLYEAGQLNFASAVGAGYMVDSVAAGFKVKNHA